MRVSWAKVEDIPASSYSLIRQRRFQYFSVKVGLVLREFSTPQKRHPDEIPLEKLFILLPYVYGN